MGQACLPASPSGRQECLPTRTLKIRLSKPHSAVTLWVEISCPLLAIQGERYEAPRLVNIPASTLYAPHRAAGRRRRATRPGDGLPERPARRPADGQGG